eukprot:1381013-Prymnesium_polylepis.1
MCVVNYVKHTRLKRSDISDCMPHKKAIHQHRPYLGSRARPTNAALRARARPRSAAQPAAPARMRH